MSADAHQSLGQSVIATTLFANNILLTLTSGDWDIESQFKPLLHTWSVGVEEQYYFLVQPSCSWFIALHAGT
jgi:peptidoglycan/LPS O-acetylase OafA/YrhL